MKPACRDHLGKQFAGSQQMLLADDFIEARRPDAVCERLRGRLFLREQAPGCGFAPHPSTLSYEVRAASGRGNNAMLTNDAITVRSGSALPGKWIRFS
jgi:hypothetical protein